MRDELIGRPHADKDYVVLNSSREELMRRGYRPVGKTIEVFLSPETKEEHVLIYGSLKEDLERRDLTINSMAKNLRSGEIIDPFGGMKDLRSRVLRRTSDRFAEDPVRALRLARFRSELPGFCVDPETELYTQGMLNQAEIFKDVPSERLKNEFQKALRRRET